MSKYIPRLKGIVAPCRVCKKDFKRRSAKHQICSPQCTKVFQGRENTLGIATSSVGSISEMMICAEMLKRGYSVFRTVSNASFCDVIAVKKQECLFIEVRTGYLDLLDRVTFPKKLHTAIAMPTHYGVYIPKTKEVRIQEIPSSLKELYEQKSES